MELLNPKEAAKMLGVSVGCLRVWETKGKLTVVRTLGGHRRFLLKEINNLLKKMQN